MAGTTGIYENGIYHYGDVRLSDLAGRKALPIGVDVFPVVANNYVLVDKSMLIADVVTAPGATTLYCRPRRFGKSLNLSMLQHFFEIPSPSDPASKDTHSLFKGLAIWDAENGSYRKHHAAYPVARFSFNDVKKDSWEATEGALRLTIASEYNRHSYLADSPKLNDADRAFFSRVLNGEANSSELAVSLNVLTTLLQKHHESNVVVLIDEYDAPVMAGYTHGYYDEVVGFLKGWLTGALKSNPVLAFGVLTGVQRISKESIFSDLNNLIVNTSLSAASDERYGFTQSEVDALAAYREQAEGVALARAWYDGYRFGNADVYNPWSALSYFQSGCVPGTYWGNTSGNGVLGALISGADSRTLKELYQCMEPEGFVEKRLDTSVVFPDVGIRQDAVWSMLYLAGYLTTEDTYNPTDTEAPRALRIPNNEVRKLFRGEIIERFAREIGGRNRLDDLHRALMEGDAEIVAEELESVLLNNASYHDLHRESSYHMLLLGLLFGMLGYHDPVSNREAGRGRFDVRITPVDPDRRPVITLEAKWAAVGSSEADGLPALAQAALAQIKERAYESGVEAGTAGTICWGIAFSGKKVACTCAENR